MSTSARSASPSAASSSPGSGKIVPAMVRRRSAAWASNGAGAPRAASAKAMSSRARIPSARAAGSSPGGRFEGQHLFAVEDERTLLAAPRPGQKRAQRQPPQPLLPAGPIARQVALRPGRRGRRHGRSPAPRRAPANLPDRPRESGGRRRGASPRAADRAARESRAAAPARARPRRGCAARRGGEIDDRVRQARRRLEHRLRERQVDRGAGGRDDDREVGEGQRLVGAHARPDRGGDRLQLPARIGRRDDGQAVVVAPRGAGRDRPALQHGRLNRSQPWRARTRRRGEEARIDLAVGQAGEQLDVVASRARPGPKRRIARRRRDPRLVGRQAIGAEGVDMQLGRARQRLEDRAVQARDIRDPEQVHGGRRPEHLGGRLGEELGQGHHPLGAQNGRADRAGPARAHVASAAMLDRPRQPTPPPARRPASRGAKTRTRRTAPPARPPAGRVSIRRVPAPPSQVVPHRADPGPCNHVKSWNNPKNAPSMRSRSTILRPCRGRSPRRPGAGSRAKTGSRRWRRCPIAAPTLV